MRVTAATSQSVRESPGAARAGARLPEKASASSCLGDKPEDAPRRERKTSAFLAALLVCRDETRRPDPFWDGPRLVPGFVAQLLGQVAGPAHYAPPPGAYGRAVEKRALLLDLRS